ncbi:uncharacterized protein [Oryza sativa Japonica Group]|uniref:Os05g0341900 protein n=2 Tax=Oryza sativa subsp. japonica TaxID=39947 RepID=A0A0N7KKK5_ORYSJ|nr:uncharacterized protein LOC107276192 [Oryza sativa Japonica Group]AAV43862.1 hypothetical protein [Oryza sativa Japonica Group]EEE63314.1 hypothetical protein OsJ_18125 [Oryza sativa Japonica Group]KAF2930286.1 hypothetical protein DAI22_05g123300 [Oryza sativa Japonica Group]BAS93473.1 Os05g0341900 [Oryza sativa Japonica Group]
MARADSAGAGAPEAIDGELVELELGERNNGVPPVAEEEGGEPRPGGRPPASGRRLLRRLSPASVARACGRWLRHPAHLALLAWALCVAASGAMLALLLLGALDGAFPRKSARNRWIEVNNQVLNALFTLMSIYQHPALFHHAAMLLRWRPDDVKALRKAYRRRRKAAAAGDGAGGWERLHMSVVVALLHVACFAQYAMCGLYWGYSRKARPDAAETSLAVIGAATPALAGLYAYFGPLGRRKPGTATSARHQEEPDDLELAAAAAADVVVAEWAGGLLDVGDDPTAWWLSCLCTFCVFGWNMERMGLGNKHVHAVTFALLCFAPLWVLNVAAMNIRDEAVGDAVGAVAVALCALGLLYGGYWRARMRRRFGLLPGRHGGGGACCGSPSSLADYLRWMFCWSCALAQEVRTANVLLLDADEAGGAGGGSSSSGGGGRGDATLLQPLPRENGVKLAFHHAAAVPVDTDAAYGPPVNGSPHRGSGGGGDESPLLQRQQGRESQAEEMRPPLQPLMTEAECRRVQ